MASEKEIEGINVLPATPPEDDTKKQPADAGKISFDYPLVECAGGMVFQLGRTTKMRTSRQGTHSGGVIGSDFEKTAIAQTPASANLATSPLSLSFWRRKTPHGSLASNFSLPASPVQPFITDLLVVQGLYRDFLPILCALDLNHEGVRYYAQSVIKSEIFQVTRRSSEDRYLHLIAFITHQYFRLQDNLLDVLLNVLQTCLNTAQREHKEVCYRRREHWNEAVRKLIGYFDHSFLEILSTIKQITESAQLDDAEKVGQIRSLLAAEEPDRHQAEASLAPLKRDLESETDGEDYYGIWRLWYKTA